MWESNFEKIYSGVTKEAVWSAWADVNNWPKWDSELEFTQMSGAFIEGNRFVLKAKGGPKVTVQLTKVIHFYHFTDVTVLPLAKMYDYHEVDETPQGLMIKSKIWVEGPLAWLWRRLVAEGVAAGVAAQTEALIQYAKSTESAL